MALIGHWPLNGDANDLVSTSPLNGSVTNAVVDNSGKIGKAYYFDGSGDYISFSGSASKLDIKNQISMAVWVKATDTSTNYQGLFLRQSVGVYESWIHQGKFMMGIKTDGGAISRNSSTSSLSNNTWYHLCWTYDGSNIRMYINGVLDRTIAKTGVIDSSDATLYIGYSGYSTEYLTGYVNDARLYDHALSQMEVYEIAKAKILHYTMDDPEEEPTTNLIGNGDFTGGNNVDDFISGNSYGTYDIIQFANNPGGSQYVLRQRSGEYEVNITVASSKTYTMSCWVSYTNDWNGTTQIMHARAFSSSANHIVTNGAGTLLETRVVNGVTWERREQTINTPSDSTGALSWYIGYDSTQATVGYRYFTNLQFEEKDHSTPFVDGTRNIGSIDASGFGINGTTDISNSPEYTTTARLGSGAFDINGSGGSGQSGGIITVSNTTAQLNAGINNPFTFSLWLRPTGTAVAAIIRKNGQFELYKNGSNFYYRTWNPTQAQTASSATYSTNNWYHLVATHDGSSTGKLYINGALDTTISRSGSPALTTETLGIGAYPDRAYATDGIIDDFRFYGTELSADDVKSLYERRGSIDNMGNIYASEINEIDSSGNPSFDSSGFSNFVDFSNVGIADSNLKAYWPLTEDAQDYSGNEYNLTATNSPTVSKDGHYFNGTNQYLTIAHTTELNPSTADFTYSFAFKSPTLRSGELFGKRTSGAGNIEAQISNTGIVYTYFANTSGTTSSITVSSGYSADTWHHYSVTRSGTSAIVYIDGVQRGTATLPAGLDISPTSAFEIGRDPGNGSEYFQGYVKDFKYFTRALTAQEVEIEHKMSISTDTKSQISNDKKMYFKGDIFEAL